MLEHCLGAMLRRCALQTREISHLFGIRMCRLKPIEMDSPSYQSSIWRIRYLPIETLDVPRGRLR
jgi:hypothetical protein